MQYEKCPHCGAFKLVTYKPAIGWQYSWPVLWVFYPLLLLVCAIVTLAGFIFFIIPGLLMLLADSFIAMPWIMAITTKRTGRKAFCRECHYTEKFEKIAERRK